MSPKDIFIGNNKFEPGDKDVAGEFCSRNGRRFYKIANYDGMDRFFMSITNPDNVWLFISSTGGITCGRENSDNALFPYTTEDRVAESAGNTGSFTLFRVEKDDKQYLWEPFASAGEDPYRISRNLYKSIYGDQVIFEEVNHDLNLVFSYGWEASPKWGIHRMAEVKNLSDQEATLYVLDGLRNILPAGASEAVQTNFSILLDAYKRNELAGANDPALYALSATLTDKAEPSESLRATTVWSWGAKGMTRLLSESQIEDFRRGADPLPEKDIRGKRGAYLVSGTLTLPPEGSRQWGQCSELKQEHADVVELVDLLTSDPEELKNRLTADIDASRERLTSIIKENDGIQQVGSQESEVHHAANVLFNVMRGGYFIDGYTIDTADFTDFCRSWNKPAADQAGDWFKQLPETLSVAELTEKAVAKGDADLVRLAFEYLPITFSRRHGDPSRPWNRFNIVTKDKEGNPVIGYQGNWRDIFQNWEALCISYPLFFPSVITKFLNATTTDGYNPYRISQDGIDWEVPAPDDPWANIGYWSDHQIVYLSRLLEHGLNFVPDQFGKLQDKDIFVFANVPYRIREFASLLDNPYDSIEFDRDANKDITARTKELGADGKLLAAADGELIRASIGEKLLVLFLAKLANYVPGGGIWMNTQRPEWNDANNALAGWGLSVVTLSYLVRFLEVIRLVLTDDQKVHSEVALWIQESVDAVNSAGAESVKDPAQRFDLLKKLGEAGSKYRRGLYEKGFSGGYTAVSKQTVSELIETCINHFNKTLDSVRRKDGMFESYQILSVNGEKAEVDTLYPMLEGQVAGLSLPEYTPNQVLEAFTALRSSSLFREDQHSYMLYPNRELPGYMQKNTIPAAKAAGIPLLAGKDVKLEGVITKDSRGDWHFDGSFTNAGDLKKAVSHLPAEVQEQLAGLFESVFNHKAFTGRSGTFFAYEGLGSIYWHMVSKLLLAVQERFVEALKRGADRETLRKLKEAYIDVRKGIGFNKSPEVYGAFPTDPYSHTPWGRGAQQPGMTGQVKEEVITRYAELGLVVDTGRITIQPELILKDQFLTPENSFTFTFCGVPFTVSKGSSGEVTAVKSSGTSETQETLTLDRKISEKIFYRTGEITAVEVQIREQELV